MLRESDRIEVMQSGRKHVVMDDVMPWRWSVTLVMEVFGRSVGQSVSVRCSVAKRVGEAGGGTLVGS